MTTITTAPEEQRVIEEVPKQLYIGGEWRDGAKGTLAVEDPSTGESLCEVADASTDDAKAALGAAVDAGPEWIKCPPRERGEILRRAFEALIERQDELATLMTLEMGKPVTESKAEIVYAAEFLRWYSEQAVRIDGRYAVAPNGQGRLLTMKQPVGACRGLHDCRQAGQANAAVDADARQDPRGGRIARGRPEPRDRLVFERDDGAADRRPTTAQAVLHRLD